LIAIQLILNKAGGTVDNTCAPYALKRSLSEIKYVNIKNVS
jgi:hypothetical protein